MNSPIPVPANFEQAITDVASHITCYEDNVVAVEDTPENNARISTLAQVFKKSEEEVKEAVEVEIERQQMEEPHDAGLTAHLILGEQENFMKTGDER